MRRNHSHISFILDRSGSMSSLRLEAIGGFNAFVDSQRAEPGTADLSLVLFDHEYLSALENVDMKRVPHLTEETYVPRGTTALHDAIGRTIDDVGVRLVRLPESKRPEKVIIAILTDGLENASCRYTPKKVAQMIAHQRKKYVWEFVFLGANQDAILTAQQLSIDPSAAYSFAPTPLGVAEAYGSLNREISTRRRMPRN